MKEKASPNEVVEDVIPRIDPDDPGLPAGEELAIDPVAGDEIDPVDKWWEKIETPEQEKSTNRRLEELEHGELPVRKKLPPILAAELEEIPAVTLSPTGETAAPLLPKAEEAAPATVTAPESPAARESQAVSDLEPAAPVAPALESPPATGPSRKPPALPPAAAPAEAASPSPAFGEGEEKPVNPAGEGEMPDFDIAPLKRNHQIDLTKEDDLVELFGGKEAAESGAKPSIFREPAGQPKAGKLPPSLPPPPGPAASEAVSGPPPDPVEAPPAGQISEAAETPGLVAEAAVELPDPDPAEEITPLSPPTDPAPAETSTPMVSETAPETAPATTPAPVAVIGDGLPAVAGTRVKAKAGCWTIFATLYFLATMLLLLLVIGAVVAWKKLPHFEDRILGRAVSFLEERGVYLDHGAWRYEFPGRIVFDELTLYDAATKERPSLKATNLGIEFRLSSLGGGSGIPGSAEFIFDDSKVSLFEKGEPFAEIEGVNGEITADPSSLTVERLAAEVGGLRLHLDGVVHLAPESGTPKSDAASESGAGSSALASLDFSGVRALQPWLGLEATGEERPVLQISFDMDSAEPELARVEGTLVGGAMKWQGIDLASLSAVFRANPGTGELRFPSVQIGYGEGLAVGSFSIDTAAQKLSIERLQSSVDLVALLSAYRLDLADTFRAIRCVDAPSLRVTGEVPLGEPSQANLKILYEHREGFVWTVDGKELPLRDLRGNFTFNRGSLETNDAAAELFGGTVALNGATNLLSESRPFNGLIEISALPLENAAEFFGATEKGLSGRLFLTFRGVGHSEIEKIRGGGTLRIDEAVLPSFPVLAQVRSLVGRVVPVFGRESSGSVTGAYLVESGTLVTNDLTVAGGGARIVTAATLILADKTVRFSSRASLEPALAAATALGDKAIVVEGEGPLEKPELRLESFPVEFAADSLGGVLGTSPETLKSLGDLIGEEGGAEVITGTLEEATGIRLDDEVKGFLESLLGEKEPEIPRAAPVEN